MVRAEKLIAVAAAFGDNHAAMLADRGEDAYLPSPVAYDQQGFIQQG